MSEKIVVAGAGLVGSLAAIFLKQRGFDVDLYEARSDMRKSTSGAGKSINLIITSRGLNALKKVGLAEKMLELTVPVTGRMMHAKTGELTYQPYGKDPSECNYSVSRAELNMALMTEAEEAGVRIHFDAGVENVDIEKKTINLSNGSETEYHRLFGTDGAGSKVRQAVTSAIENSTDRVEWLEADYKELFMPAAAGGTYAIEKNALHIWPRGDHFLMALPNLGGSFTMTLYMSEERFETLKTKEQVRSFFEAEYPDSVSLMPGFEDEFFENPQGKLGTLRADPWVYEDSVALMGDAAHAIVPFFGQGMNCGFEDCSVLFDLFDREKNWLSTFQKYHRQQKPNGDAIADMAVENYVEMMASVADDRFLLKKAVETKIQKAYPDLYRARYGMVTYTLIPYELAKKAGEIQGRILDQLVEGITQADQVDMKRAKELVEKEFTPFVNEHNLDLSRFRL